MFECLNVQLSSLFSSQSTINSLLVTKQVSHSLKGPCEETKKLINLSSTRTDVPNFISADAKEDGIIFPGKFETMA